MRRSIVMRDTTLPRCIASFLQYIQITGRFPVMTGSFCSTSRSNRQPRLTKPTLPCAAASAGCLCPLASQVDPDHLGSGRGRRAIQIHYIAQAYWRWLHLIDVHAGTSCPPLRRCLFDFSAAMPLRPESARFTYRPPHDRLEKAPCSGHTYGCSAKPRSQYPWGGRQDDL